MMVSNDGTAKIPTTKKRNAPFSFQVAQPPRLRRRLSLGLARGAARVSRRRHSIVEARALRLELVRGDGGQLLGAREGRVRVLAFSTGGRERAALPVHGLPVKYGGGEREREGPKA